MFAFDLTGQGYSDAVAPFDVDHDVRQTLAFTRALGLTGADAPVLVGHSSAAAIVGLAALEAPDDVAGVMFLDGDALPLEVPAGRSAPAGRPVQDHPRPARAALGPADHPALQQPVRPDLRPAGRGGRRPLAPAAAAARDRAGAALERAGVIPAMTSEQLEALRRSSTPRLVVWGHDDVDGAYTADSPGSTATAIGAPSPIFVPGRHLTMISSPDEVAAAVRRLEWR